MDNAAGSLHSDGEEGGEQRATGNDERRRLEERSTHPGCLLCADENAS